MFAHWRSTLLVFLLWSLLYLPGLFAPEFKGEESRRAIIAHEMIQSGDWAQPYLAGEKYDRKPPLFNWLIASSWIVGGVESEGLARLPSALAILALALVALAVLRSLLENQAGLLAALVVLVNPGSWEKGRMAEIEAVYSCLFGIALLLWLWGSRRSVSWRIPAFFGCGLCLGLAILAKGPLPLLWFMLVFPLYFVITEKKWHRLWRCEWLFVVVPAALVAVPWFWWSAQQGIVEQGMVEQGVVLNSATSAEESAMGVWVSELMVRVRPTEGWSPLNPLKVFFEGLVNWMPWPLFLLLILIPQWRKGLTLDFKRAKFLRNWLWATVIAYAPIALAPNGNGRYMMPLTVAVAVLVSVFLVDPQLWDCLKKMRRAWLGSLLVLRWVVLFVLLGIFLASWALFPEESVSWRLLWWGLGVLCLVLAWQLVARLRSVARWTPWVTASTLLFAALVGAYGFALDTIARGSEHRRGLAQLVNHKRILKEQVWLYRFDFKGGKDGWIHYLEGKRDYLPEREFDLEKLGEGPVEIITSSKRWARDEDDLERRLGKANLVTKFQSSDQSDKRKWVLAVYRMPQLEQNSESWADQVQKEQQEAWGR